MRDDAMSDAGEDGDAGDPHDSGSDATDDAGSDAGETCPIAPDEVEVAPLFGEGNWNDYVRNDAELNAPCDVTDASSIDALDKCLHAGVIRTVSWSPEVPRSCDDVHIEDSLHVFEWECDDSTAGTLELRAADDRPRTRRAATPARILRGTGLRSPRQADRVYASYPLLDRDGIKFACHWGQMGGFKKERVQAYYGPNAAAWTAARKKILKNDPIAAQVFASRMLARAGL